MLLTTSNSTYCVFIKKIMLILLTIALFIIANYWIDTELYNFMFFSSKHYQSIQLRRAISSNLLIVVRESIFRNNTAKASEVLDYYEKLLSIEADIFQLCKYPKWQLKQYIYEVNRLNSNFCLSTKPFVDEASFNSTLISRVPLNRRLQP